MRRLNRAEYNNTVRDLFGTQLQPANVFPEDDFGFGFDNIGDVLSVSLAHIEQFSNAADALLEEALGIYPQQEWLFEAENARSDGGMYSFALEENWVYGANSSLFFDLKLPAAGRYRLTARAGQDAAGDEDAHLAILLGNEMLAGIDVDASKTAMQVYQVEIDLPAGEVELSANFTNDYWVLGVADRNLYLDFIELVGPLSSANVNGVDCAESFLKDESCVQNILETFGTHAWRRPLDAEEINSLVTLFTSLQASGASYQDGLFYTLKALLMSPHFIYRPELNTGESERPLNAYELASRLSYFLWSSMPDETLFSLAADGSLLTDEVLREQVKRMLEDPKSQALIENFAVQWLEFDRIQNANPDRNQFPSFDKDLMESMRSETRFFLRDLFESNAPIATLFTSRSTYLNDPLAAHYGVGGVNSGNSFRKYTWINPNRYGILGQASVLLATSNPTSTSPVKRGKWVLTNLLCDEPESPPPNVENIAERLVNQELTTRERFSQHSEIEVCAFCHRKMDPIGFGLENYDPIGRWRTEEVERPIDAIGILPDGSQFNGPAELSQLLASSNRLAMCFADRLATYALGRGVEAFKEGEFYEGYPYAYSIYQQTKDNGHRIADIIEAVVLSDMFRSFKLSEEETDSDEQGVEP